MKRTILIITLIGIIFSLNAQNSNELDKIVTSIKENSYGDIETKCIDLDNDGDKDYIFTYYCGESKCFEVFLTINGQIEQVIKEFGNLSYDYENSVDFQLSNLILKADFNHCCGEGPFDSFRRFIFKKDKAVIVENFVRYDHENYCKDKLWNYTFIPARELEKYYWIKITKDGNNIRFSADLENHNADFTCIENTNIIGQLNIGAEIKVLAEKQGKDRDLRTWLYVEIDKSDLKTSICISPLSYDFENQQLRGWISDKYTTSQ